MKAEPRNLFTAATAARQALVFRGYAPRSLRKTVYLALSQRVRELEKHYGGIYTGADPISLAGYAANFAANRRGDRRKS